MKISICEISQSTCTIMYGSLVLNAAKLLFPAFVIIDSYLSQFPVSADTGWKYAKLTGDYSPHHLNQPLAIMGGYEQPMAHGMWTLSRALATLLEGKAWWKYSKVHSHNTSRLYIVSIVCPLFKPLCSVLLFFFSRFACASCPK